MDWRGAPGSTASLGSSLIQLLRSASAEDGWAHPRQTRAPAQSSGRRLSWMNRDPAIGGWQDPPIG